MSPLKTEYLRRHSQFLKPVAEKLETYLKELCSPYPRIDRVSSRAKSVDRFMQKAENVENGKSKYSDPLIQIQDQIGARIVTFYPLDIPAVSDIVTHYFRPIESVDIVPDGDNEFGYVGKHFILLLPSDVTADFSAVTDVPSFFELQIKTLFQHAWAEAEHDLGYKPSVTLSSLQKRKMAFTAAQAWGADQMFDEMFRELNTAANSKQN
jgi:putative GTP pyrophosphokinase